MLITFTMLVIGLICGFIGVGGAGFIISILVLFHIPIHTALGTSLAAMAFTTLSGTYSHMREGNIALRAGVWTGGFGAIAAYFGSRLSSLIPGEHLHYLTAGMLLLSAVLLIVRFFITKGRIEETINEKLGYPSLLMKALILGMTTGLLSGAFGIGSAPFIQIGLLLIFGLSIRQSIGTTMLVILPIAVGGGFGYVMQGYLDYMLLLQVLAGTMIGAYLGAKLTKFAPKPLLKTAMVATPVVAALLILFE
ncbi:hypothetical protein GA0061096_3545 [Fictibacillus enclensis]|uniref:Probable membrane transporter protein n=1 Tax=Fictibacillus enclensis TaxID=1017270 RepID=A0A0V8J5G2_9BACL|nr:sulfite exporter TauE/SafE family protein [Fictibacillus enclensis]KSU81952.1 hypothetical protein AS030_16855 [Fictibacillus enclensis]SCC28307.1 hypothetical protein GA0061096_3545 [Fictibacillus enclensis]